MRQPDSSRFAELVWYGRSPLAVVLQPFAALFALAVAVRCWCYRHGLLSTYRLPVPVVVVGNVTVGGTGKTPVVEWLVGILRAGGFNPGIVSRGYGRRTSRITMVTPDSTVETVGDEPLLLSRRTGAPVCVGRNRVRAAGELLLAGVDVIIADDGLQHYRLARDLEIAVIDGVRRLGNGKLLPAGPLREPAGRLAMVDLILVNGGVPAAGEHRFQLIAGEARQLRGGSRQPLTAFAGQTVRAVAGIGNPTRFHRMLEQHGLRVEPVPLPDHGQCDLAALLRTGDMPVLMTEKDAVKYRDPPEGPLWVVPVRLEMDWPEVAGEILARLPGRGPAGSRMQPSERTSGDGP